MKKADIILLSTVLLVGIVGIIIYFATGKDAEYISINVDGKLFGMYSLSDTREIHIDSPDGGENLLKIENGQAWMVSSNCPNQDCVFHKEISRSNESIICLPHKVVITVLKQQTEGEKDAVAY